MVTSLLLTVLLMAVVPIALRASRIPIWCTFLVGVTAHGLLWNGVDNLGAATRYGYVIAGDRVLGLGALPTEFLQSWWYAGYPRAHDWLLLAVYYSFFGLPLFLVTATRSRGYAAARVYVGALLLASALSLPVMALMPTAPPWLAAREGLVGVQEIRLHALGLDLSDALIERTNIVAAMPSLHQATAVICALAVASNWRRLRPLAIGYGLAMGVTLVYLGEHYVVDVVMGTLFALASWTLAARYANQATANPEPRLPIGVGPATRSSFSTRPENI